MAFSYCARAMSRPARAESSPAWLRPASKIGSRAWGARVQPQEPSLNRPESALLAVPALAVRAMRGKKAARAAPMLALAAISNCSAWRTSARCASRSDGRPSGTGANSGSLPPWLSRSSAGKGWPVNRVSAFTSSARRRCCCASATRAVATSDSAWRRSRAEATPWSKRRRTSRSESSRVTSVRWVSASNSSLACRLSQAFATEAIRLVCTARRASSVARYCDSAASLRLAMRPKKSISQLAMARPTV